MDFDIAGTCGFGRQPPPPRPALARADSSATGFRPFRGEITAKDTLIIGDRGVVAVAVDQIRTVSKARLGDKIGSLSKDEAAVLRRIITEMYGE